MAETAADIKASMDAIRDYIDMIAARDNINYEVESVDRVSMAYQPTLPSSSTAQTWSGSVTVQTDFSP